MDFNVKWSDNTADLTRNLQAGVMQVDATQKSIDRLVQSLSGEVQIKAADRWTQALQKLGGEAGALAGVEKLTASETDKATAAIDRAIAKYQALGQTAPKSLQDIATALQGVSSKADDGGQKLTGFAKYLDDLKPKADSASGSFSSLNHTLTEMWENPTAGAKGLATAVGTDLTAGLGTAGIALGLTAAAAVTAGVAVFEFAEKAAKIGANLNDMSEKTGIGVEALSRLRNASVVVGTDINSLSNIVFMLQKNMAESPDKFEKGLERLNIDVATFKALAPEEQLMQLSASLKSTEDPVERNAAGFELMGRQFRDIAPALYKLNEGLAMTKDLNPWTEEEARQAEQFEMHLANISLHIDEIGTDLGRTVLPYVNQFVSALDELAQWTPGDGLKQLFLFALSPNKTKIIAGLASDYARAATDAAGITSPELPTTFSKRGGFPSVMPLAAEATPAPDTSIVGTTDQETFKLIEGYLEDQKKAAEASAQAWANLTIAEQGYQGALDHLGDSVVEGIKYELEHKGAVDDIARTYAGASGNIATYKAYVEAVKQSVKDTADAEKQAAADRKKELEDEQKAQGLAYDLEVHMTEEGGKLRQKQNEADAKDKAKWLAVTNTAVKQNLEDQIAFQQATDDTLAGLYLTDEQNKLRSLDLWLEDERVKLRSRQVYSQQAEDDLVKLYQAKTQALILANDPLFEAWKSGNQDMRKTWASTWDEALSGTISFGQAFEETLTQSLWDPFKKILSGMLADFESILLNPLIGALRQLETSFVNYLVNAGVMAAGGQAGLGGTGGSGVYGSLLNMGASYGLKAGVGALTGGGAAATGAYIGPLEATAGGGVATTAAEVPSSLAATGGGGIGLGGLAGAAAGYAGIGIGTWMLGDYLGSKTESKPLGAAMGAGAGAATGAAIGSVVPGLGTGIGALVGGIAGAIAGWRAAGQMYEDVKVQQADLMKQLGGMPGEIASVGAAYALMGKSGDEAQAALHKMWDAQTPTDFAAAVKPVAEALQNLQQNTEDLAAATTNADGRISDAWARILQRNKDVGVDAQQVMAFQLQQSEVVMAGFVALEGAQDKAVAGYDAIKQAVDDANAALLKTPGDAAAAQALADALTNQKAAGAKAAPELGDLGLQAVGAYTTSVASGKSPTEALQSESAALTALQQEYKDLGLDVNDVALQSLFMRNTMLTTSGTLMAGVDGLTKEMVAQDNIGLETIDMFGAQQRTGEQMYTRLQAAAAAAGGTTKDALLPMQDYLHQALIEAEKLGVPLDALTQQMIDQSKDAGIWQDAIKPTPTLQDSMQALVDKVDDLVQALRGLPANVHTDVTTTFHTEGNPTPTPPGDVTTTDSATAARGGYVGATRIMHMSTGGPVGTDTVGAWLTPGEAILTKDATAAIGLPTIAAWNRGEGLGASTSTSTVTNSQTSSASIIVVQGGQSGNPAKLADKIIAMLPENVRKNTGGLRSNLLAALGQPVTTWT